ncbi:phosphoribosyltransferase-like protein [Rhodocollybia butyracea]|uniref:Phosphoribosyltransferase-like protein n=1 Tax=Rhodocollybia butyracea TaxID=206335 RepID=A0A9P5QB89_9AGAR|nr:phosphoribosyltransferase-like protein [Rhodocollybia butyracea]
MSHESQVKHWHVTYNHIHKIIQKCTPRIAAEFNPDLMVAIGGGGFFPARVMRTFLRETGRNKTLQIQAIGLSLYEPIDGVSEQKIGEQVVRTQWLGTEAGKMLLGKSVLIVDEVDDTRKTLSYALTELKNDIEAELLTRPEADREALRAATRFGIFVVHNKNKPKLAELPEGTAYYAGEEVDDVWLDYPWESTDIEEHDKLAAKDIIQTE